MFSDLGCSHDDHKNLMYLIINVLNKVCPSPSFYPEGYYESFHVQLHSLLETITIKLPSIQDEKTRYLFLSDLAEAGKHSMARWLAEAKQVVMMIELCTSI
jgi:hypothetical protein